MLHVRTVYIEDEGNNETFGAGEREDAERYAAHLHSRGVYCTLRATEDGSNARNGDVIATGRDCLAKYPGEATVIGIELFSLVAH